MNLEKFATICETFQIMPALSGQMVNLLKEEHDKNPEDETLNEMARAYGKLVNQLKEINELHQRIAAGKYNVSI